MINVRRREFLKSCAVGAVSAAVWPQEIAQATAPINLKEQPFVKLAVATICCDGFANRQHEPSFEIIPKTGIKNVEFNLWYANTVTPKYIRGLKRRCAEHKLTPISLQGSGFGGEGNAGVAKDLSHKLNLMSLCREIGCRRIKCTGSRRGTNGGLPAVIEVCKELAPAAEELGLLVCLENHANNVMEQIEDYDEIFAAVDSPNVGLCLDTGHFEGVSVDLHEVIERFHARINHVDLKDCRKRGAGHDTVVFGEGVTDFDAFLKHLLSTDYSGYLVIEQAWREPQPPVLANLRAAHEMFAKYET